MSHVRKRSNIVPSAADPRASNALKYQGEEYCALVISMGRKGEFPEQWCAQMGVAMSTMYNWAACYPKFDEACRIAWTALSAYWTQALLEAARGGNCNISLLLELLRRRFPDTWGAHAKNTAGHYYSCIDAAGSAKAEAEAEDFNNMTADELLVELAAIRTKSDLDVARKSRT